MVVYEVADGVGADEHDTDGDHDRGNHHPEVLRHTRCGDDGIQAEDNVQQQDLRDDGPELAHSASGRVRRVTLELLMDLERGLRNEEQASAEEDEVTAGEVLV